MKLKWLSYSVYSILLAFILLNKAHTADLPVAEEYQVKSVFLLNFSGYITWPVTAFPNPQSPFAICVLGQDPFQTALDMTIEGEKISGHPVVALRLNQLNMVNDCQILFISQSESSQLPTILTYLKYQRRPILTVSDIDGFVEQGGMIQFFKNGKKIRFMIDHKAAKEMGLWVSSNLLSIAEVVTHPDQ